MQPEIEEDIIDVIARLVCDSDTELEARLEYQQDALAESKCIDPMVGRRIAEGDAEYLFSAFGLDDENFAARFPNMAHFTREGRGTLIETFSTHLDRCLHCSLRRGYDLELGARIKRVCRENKDVLLRLLVEQEADVAPSDAERCVAAASV
ncbi:MAG TPA: hypothetical protein VJU84_06575 [Pyrinomonadaceae bacterium]|nr:hypothetical protein [Pyrinomonadaceae bacterium]